MQSWDNALVDCGSSLVMCPLEYCGNDMLDPPDTMLTLQGADCNALAK